MRRKRSIVLMITQVKLCSFDNTKRLLSFVSKGLLLFEISNENVCNEVDKSQGNEFIKISSHALIRRRGESSRAYRISSSSHLTFERIIDLMTKNSFHSERQFLCQMAVYFPGKLEISIEIYYIQWHVSDE